MRIPSWLAASLALLCAAAAFAQPYPNKPIRVVVPFTPGSASDILARILGPKMLEHWGQQVVVDNRPSAAGVVAGEIVAKSLPDGYTLMVTSSGFSGSAALGMQLPYDSVKDFAGVTQIVSTPLVLVVRPALGVKSVKDLIALAKQSPGKINFGSSGIGSGTHYAGELFRLAAGIDVVHVPYRGTPEALNDTIAGRVEYYITPILPAVSLIKSERLLALGVTTSQRIPLLPDVPTIAEAALPGFEYDGWFGVFAPAKTPRPVVDALSKEVARILGLEDVKERIAGLGAVPSPSAPDEFDKMVHADIVMRGKVFNNGGAKTEKAQ